MKCVKTKHLGQIAEKRERGGESGSMCMVLKRAIKVDIKNFSLSQGIFLIQCGFFKAVFNSRTAIAGAIFGLLLVFFISSSRFLLRPYEVTTTSDLLFVHSIIQFQLKCV